MSQLAYNIYKPLGWTPLQALETLREYYPELMGIPLTYAGRLDPMAEGVLVVLAGEEAKNREPYLELDKTYVAKILFGFSTDTGDILGIIHDQSLKQVDEKFVVSLVEKLSGEHILAVPRYSSVPVQGKPMFQWAREDVHIPPPMKMMKVYQSRMVRMDQIDGANVQHYIVDAIGKVSGDFRQQEILECWNSILQKKLSDSYQLAELEIVCGSGTYIRSLGEFIGKQLGIPTVLFHLQRTKVGNFVIEDSLQL